MTQSPAEIRRILVVGGGIAGWSAATALARTVRGRASIGVVETDEDLGEPLAIACRPDAAEFHAMLGLDEASILRGAQGAYSLGERMIGFGGEGAAYFRPFADLGAPLDGASFHQLLLRRRRQGRPEVADAYSLNAVAAELGRFAKPGPNERSVLSTLRYGFNLDGRRYAAGLRAFAESLGVTPLRGALAKAEATATGIAAVVLEGGERLEADLFLDCTGPASRLLGEALAVPVESWAADLPFDSQAETLVPEAASSRAFNVSEAAAWGWRRDTPLQGAVARRIVYASAHLDDAQVLQALPASGAVRRSKLAFGRRRLAWARNCVAIGPSAGSAGPLDLGLTLTHKAIRRLLELFPTLGGYEAARAEFNRRADEEMARVRDAALLPLVLNGRGGEPAWAAARETPQPETLAYRLSLWNSRGGVISFDEEPVPESDWIAVLLGQGPAPRRGDVLAESAMDDAALADRLGAMRRAIRQGAEQMPTHDVFLTRSGAAAGGAGR
ncbi:tryptophan halogenase family protein [Phenylobacterium deserti]|uniref:tryptophan halogenase family protein n=1 Tax=Phenylobacterium deserti TaxID=1914756 RepID=UPI0014035D96|nr:tryptophan halogenase family protein [Phenylobacterium deserti]